MPLNPAIPLNTTVIDPSQGISQLGNAIQYRQQRQRQTEQDQIAAEDRTKQNELTDLQIQQARTQIEQQGKTRAVEEMAQDAVQIQSMLNAGDVTGARNFALDRKARLTAQGKTDKTVNTVHTDRFIEALDKDPKMAAEQLNAEIQGLERLGFIKPTAQAEGFTLNPGDTRFDAQGKVIASVAPEMKAPETRKIKNGSVEVTQEFDRATGSWRDIGSTDEVAIAKQKESDKQSAKDLLTESKQELQAKAKDIRANIISGKVDEATKLVDELFTTGFIGQTLSFIGGTDARNLRSTLDTIKANLGFSELQAMREASPTGGALGQVAIQELAMLQSTISSLDQAQDDATLKSNLKAIKLHVKNWRNAVDASLEDQKENDDEALIGKYLNQEKPK